MITDILQQIQSELKAPKNQRNNFGGYNYRNCEDILEALKPILAKHKAAVIITDEIRAIGDRYYVEATAQLVAGDQKIAVKALAREEETRKGMDGSQITGSASSYARKYALNGLFAIDDTKDADTPPKDDTNEINAVKEAIENNCKIFAKAKGKTPAETKAAACERLKFTDEPTTLEGLKKINALLLRWIKKAEDEGQQ